MVISPNYKLPLVVLGIDRIRLTVSLIIRLVYRLILTVLFHLDQFQALPMAIYNWAKLPQDEFQNVASAGIIVLLIILLLMNAIAIFLRNKYSKK